MAICALDIFSDAYHAIRVLGLLTSQLNNVIMVGRVCYDAEFEHPSRTNAPLDFRDREFIDFRHNNFNLRFTVGAN